MQYRVCKKDAIRVAGVKIPIVDDQGQNMTLIDGEGSTVPMKKMWLAVKRAD